MKYIRVIDFETTGVEPAEDKIIEVGWTDVLLYDNGEIGIAPGDFMLINPGIPIPPVASSIHHIVDEDVVDAWKWRDDWLAMDAPAGGELIARAAHNAAFEAAFAGPLDGLPWICTYKCGLRLWPDAPSHSNQALRYWRKPEGLHRETANLAHRAFPDAYVTAFLLRDQIVAADNDIQSLIEWSNKPALQVTCHLGKYRGQKWADVPSGFLYWVLDKDFGEDILFTAQSELDRRRAKAEAEAEAAAQ